MPSLRQILALWLMPGMTSTSLRALVASGSTFAEILSMPPAKLAALGVRRQALQALAVAEQWLERADDQLLRAHHMGATILSFWDETYPSALREIYSPPMVLYVLGELRSEDEQSIAIVGTRNASSYGRAAAERYASGFAAAGVTVVSGLARGIDTFAHTATLNAGGRTIAVVASGLDEIGPIISANLARKISSSGAVVTEYPLGVKALPAYFPQRNRIISGLCLGTVVVESDEKGGAMITASFAMDQNREVFAVPGAITSPKSRGTNKLIRTDRARLTQVPVDVLDALGFHVPVASAVEEEKARPELSMFEQRILDSLSGEPIHVDDLCDATGIASSDMLVNLLTLEFKGLVRQMAGRMFLRV